MASFDDNPHYVRYVELLKRLHELVRTGEGDSADADDLREQMDAPWSHLSEEEIAAIDNSYSGPADAPANVEVPLTPRESEVLRHLASGLTNKEIAQTLEVSYETVREHVQHILRKIGVSDRAQAAVWAVRKQLV
jgi:DNA-binding NarL/FixJ family response regulator